MIVMTGNATSLRKILKDSLEENGETFNDVEETSLPQELDDPIPCDSCGDYDSLPGNKSRFYTWTKNRVYYFRVTWGNYFILDSVPRNPTPGSGWIA